MNLPQLPVDKAMHLIYGAAIAGVAFAGCRVAHVPQADVIALGAAAAFGVGKEALDYAQNRVAALTDAAPPHGVEFLDVASTIAGGVFVFALAFFARL